MGICMVLHFIIICYLLRHDPREPGEKRFLFYDLQFKSYGPKCKVGFYSATMRQTGVIIFDMHRPLDWRLYNFRGKFPELRKQVFRSKHLCFYIFPVKSMGKKIKITLLKCITTHYIITSHTNGVLVIVLQTLFGIYIYILEYLKNYTSTNYNIYGTIQHKIRRDIFCYAFPSQQIQTKHHGRICISITVD